MSELEVTAFTADFRAHQGLCPGDLVGEVGGGAIPLDNGKAFIKCRGADTGAHVQVVFQGDCGGGMGTDHQCLGRAQFLEKLLQPADARVEIQPAVVHVGQLRVELFL